MRGKAQPLTAAQLHFAELVAAGMSQYEAHRTAYPGSKGKRETIDVKASRMVKHEKIAPVIARLKAQIEAKMAASATYTREDALKELHRALELATSLGKPNAMVQASIGKSRVAGFLRDEPVVPMTPLGSQDEQSLWAKAVAFGAQLGLEIAREAGGKLVAVPAKKKPKPEPIEVQAVKPVLAAPAPSRVKFTPVKIPV